MLTWRAWLAVIAVPLFAGGCESDPEVVVRASVDAPIGELPVRLLPYNRDSVIADLQEDATSPRPEIPPELLAQIDSLQQAPAGRAGDSVAAVREQTLRTLRARADSIREEQREWSAEALAGFEEAVRGRIAALGGVEELVDTTDAAGQVVFRAPSGRWWVFSRYLLADRELYWNLPIDVGSEPRTVELNPENAESRPAY